MLKIDTRKLKPEAQRHLRNQAIRLRKAGRSQAQIGEITKLHPANVLSAESLSTPRPKGDPPKKKRKPTRGMANP